MRAVAARLSRALDVVEDGTAYCCGLILVAVVLGVSTDVLRRQFIGGSLPWIVQFSEYAMLYLAFLPAAWVLRSGSHISVEIVTDLLPDRVQHHVGTVAHLVGTLAAAAATMWTFRYFWASFSDGTLFFGPVVIERWMVHIAMPLGLGLLTLEFLRQTYRHVVGAEAVSEEVEASI